jgi:hypothetical protein
MGRVALVMRPYVDARRSVRRVRQGAAERRGGCSHLEERRRYDGDSPDAMEVRLLKIFREGGYGRTSMGATCQVRRVRRVRQVQQGATEVRHNPH